MFSYPGKRRLELVRGQQMFSSVNRQICGRRIDILSKKNNCKNNLNHFETSCDYIGEGWGDELRSSV